MDLKSGRALAAISAIGVQTLDFAAGWSPLPNSVQVLLMFTTLVVVGLIAAAGAQATGSHYRAEQYRDFDFFDEDARRHIVRYGYMILTLCIVLIMLYPQGSGGPRIQYLGHEALGRAWLCVPAYLAWLAFSNDRPTEAIRPFWRSGEFAPFIQRGEWMIFGICAMAAIAANEPDPRQGGSVESGGGYLGWAVTYMVNDLLGPAITAALAMIMLAAPLWALLGRAFDLPKPFSPVAAAAVAVVAVLIPLQVASYVRGEAPWQYQVVPNASHTSYEVTRSTHGSGQDATRLTTVNLNKKPSADSANHASSATALVSKNDKNAFSAGGCAAEARSRYREPWVTLVRPIMKTDRTCFSQHLALVVGLVDLRLPAYQAALLNESFGAPGSEMLGEIGREVCADAAIGFFKKLGRSVPKEYGGPQLATAETEWSGDGGACILPPRAA